MMVNHPNRGRDLNAAIRRTLSGFAIHRIEIIATRNGFTMRAHPDGFHPLVAKRRDAAFAEKAEWSLKEASAVHEGAMAPVAQATADTLDDALQALRKKLQEMAA